MQAQVSVRGLTVFIALEHVFPTQTMPMAEKEDNETPLNQHFPS
jgi:hypothetical protein